MKFQGPVIPVQLSGAVVICNMLGQPKQRTNRTSLVVQWLRLCTLNAGGLGSIPGQGTRSHILQVSVCLGFPSSSAGKKFTCNAGGLIPGSRQSPGEGIGYPLQYSWASLVAQLVKNLPAMWETWVGSLGWEDPLEKGTAIHACILAWRIPWTV